MNMIWRCLSGDKPYPGRADQGDASVPEVHHVSIVKSPANVKVGGPR
jgi:hypothetical protein